MLSCIKRGLFVLFLLTQAPACAQDAAYYGSGRHALSGSGLSASGGGGGGGGSADVSNSTQLLAAIAGASAGQTITLAAGEYGQNFSPPARTLSPAVIIKSLNCSNKATFTATGTTNPAIDITNWNGITLECLEIRHTETVTVDNPYRLIKMNSASNVTIKNSYIHGDVSKKYLHGIGVVFASGVTNFLAQQNTIKWLGGGFNFYAGSSNITIRYNLFQELKEDALGGAASNVLIEYNKFKKPQPSDGAGGPGYSDHGDVYQGYSVTDSVDNVVFRYNFVRSGEVNYERWQSAFFPDNESGISSRYGNITASYNVIIGGQPNAIFINGVAAGTNNVHHNDVYDITGRTDGGGSQAIRFAESTSHYGNNQGGIYNDPYGIGNTLTNDGGGSATGSVNDAGADALEATWDASYTVGAP